MNCEQFERLIALQVEGDLPDAQQSKLSNHLSVCGSCHRFAEEIRDSQAALRGYTGEDFDESLLAGIRQSVMSQIHSGEIALSRWERIAGWFGIREFNRFIWVISGAAAVLVIASTIGFYIFLRSGSSIEIAVNTPKLSVPQSGISPDHINPQPENYGAGVPIRRPAVKRRPYSQQSMMASNISPLDMPSPSKGISELPDMSAPAVETDQSDPIAMPTTKKDVTRIEIQTANPNIRIIWFVDKKPNAPPVGVLSDGEEAKF